MKIRVPDDVATSPQDDGQVRFDPDTRTFSDDHGNTWSVDELAAARPGNKVRKWVRENYPEKRSE